MTADEKKITRLIHVDDPDAVAQKKQNAYETWIRRNNFRMPQDGAEDEALWLLFDAERPATAANRAAS